MRKYLLFLMTLCTLMAARGQTGWQYEYWFDNDRSTLKTGVESNGTFNIAADVSGLVEGLHAIHIEAAAQSDKTKRSVPVTRYFVKTPVQTKARCWFDNDLSTLQTGVSTGEPVMLDVASLKDGFHIINVQVEGDSKGLSSTTCYPFVKIPQVVGVDNMTCLCMVDDQLYKQEQVSASGGIINWQFDVSSLSQGFHRLFVQVVTPSGAATALYQGFFFRETTKTEFSEMKCVYAIDGGNFDNVAGTLADGTFHFDLDVASLSDGLHRIAYMLSNGKGVTTKVQTQFFTKIPLGGYGTVEYWYWLNDQQGDDIVKTKVDPRQNPYNIQALLPVAQVPLRSQQFAFAVEGGKPVIYAKNTFHGRFYDASGRFVDMNKDFVDQRVRQVVSESTLLQTVALGSRQVGPRLAPAASTVKSISMTKPVDNAISWYRMEVKAGDSLQFHLDRPATMQLFSPTGVEVYHAEGAASVKWDGLHAEETGTYYLAVHDATSKYGTTLTLYYELIDRYAVLRQDIAKVGSGGPSTITFQGNGFDKLQKVTLVKGGTTLNGVEIGHEGKAVTSVKIDFGGAPLGDYDAVFTFGEGGETETLTIVGGITVETPVPITLDGTVSYAPQFLVSRGNQYEFRITNHGNMTKYDHKMRLYIYTEALDNLQQVLVNGIELHDGTGLKSDSIASLPYRYCFDILRSLRPSTTDIKTANVGPIYVKLDSIGGGSKAVASLDPNDIYGYQDENGSKFIKEGLRDVYYTIEFENDPAFATAAAHDIYVTDELDPTLFDLTTFMPTRVKIGEKEVTLSPADTSTDDKGMKTTVVTIDMRPQINALAEVKCEFDPSTGKAQWHVSSLDPMTMEDTTVPMDGVLPVNSDGNGIGQLSFDISLKAGLATGTEVPNKATITFDTNKPIETPTWTNIIGQAPSGGDVNGDGIVNIVDVTMTISHILGQNPDGFNAEAADVNGDKTVNIVDVTSIIDIILKAK